MLDAMRLLIIAAAASLLSLVPAYFVDPGPDIIHHITLTECFVEQLWAGELYPRWCEKVNAGLGSQIFITYYPLAYYITSIFYPLTWMGGNILLLLAVSAWFAGVVSWLTVYLWLKDQVGKQAAIAAGFLYLLLPYRMEVLYMRPSLPELWVMAFYPLVFLYIRQIAKTPSLPKIGTLAALISICLLTQVPTTLCILMVGGMYLFCLSLPKIKPTIAYGAAAILGLMGSLFYIAAAREYQQFLSPSMAIDMKTVWVCRHMLWEDLTARPWAVFGFACTMTLFLLLTFKIGLALRSGTLSIARRDYIAFVISGTFSCLMLFPVSEPLWELWRATGAPGMPWRMQAGVGLSVVALASYLLGTHTSKAKYQPKQGDVVALVMFLLFLSFGYGAIYTEEAKKTITRIIAAKAIQFDEHFSRWTDETHYKLEELIKLHERYPDRPLSKLVPNTGIITTAYRMHSGFVIEAQLMKPASLVIEHFYFPSWRATGADGKIYEITPLQGSGRMSIQLAEGQHRINLTHDVYGNDGLVAWSRQVSLGVWILIVALAFWRQKNRSALE
ncbi:MAG: hypothetical protein SFW63_07785 [Alphaproteobacteria bacterium]|nr:hypothetical protein [Alphaproteobacteria bacterium]